MNNRSIIVISFLLGLSMIFVDFPEGAVAAVVVGLLSTLTIVIIRRAAPDDADFLIQIFLVALIARLVFGILLEVYYLREFFAGDAFTYDVLGYRLTQIWNGTAPANDQWSEKAQTMASGWGMNYFVAGIYYVTGRSAFTVQSICGFIGAATVPLVYGCTLQVFNNRRVAKTAAVIVAFYPAFIIWSGQILKDGLIIFLLVLSISMVVRLQKKFDYASVFVLIFSLFGVLSLRFYIFYMVAAAVVGSFVVGFNNSSKSLGRRLTALVVLGVALTYVGALRNASDEFDKYGNMEQLQNIRRDSVESAHSGYGEGEDVSTAGGALSALPVGLIYLLLAPFPWEMTSFRQAITLPEMLFWWASVPLMISGIWYTIKNKLRPSLAILIFTLMLTLVYAIFQGNVGTAYRQRTQIQVFLVIFVAVGWTLRREKKEYQNAARLAKRREQLNRTLEVRV